MMPYFVVDDGFHSHRKAVKAGLAAIGLWARAGSWCNDNGTDGFIPDYVAAQWDPDYEMVAARLVEVRLWEVAEVDGEKGWQFHDWTGEEDGVRRNYTKAENLQRRRDWAERQSRSRARRTGGKGVTGEVTDGVTLSVTPDVTRDSRETHAGVTGEVTHESRESHPLPSPSPSPSPSPISSKPVGVQTVDPLTSKDRPNGHQPQKPPDFHPVTGTPRRKHRCDDHGSPDDWECNLCQVDHGDRAHGAKRRLGQCT